MLKLLWRLNDFQLNFKIRTASGNKTCLDAPDNDEQIVELHKCHGLGSHQYWEYRNETICRENYCLVSSPSGVKTRKERKAAKAQKWIYQNMQLVLKENNKCLTISSNSKLTLQDCDETAGGQKWILENFLPNKS